jgi:transposase
MDTHLQAIIGTDKNNPLLTVVRNSKEKTIDVYYGVCLFDVIIDKPDNPELKHLIARLFNAGVKRKSLIDNFGYSFNTIKRWADALKTGDPQTIFDALSGQGAPKKLTIEMKSFITHRFKKIYLENKYSYSKEIREEIVDVFQKDISAETLRPLFNELKEKYFSTSKKNFNKFGYPQVAI